MSIHLLLSRVDSTHVVDGSISDNDLRSASLQPRVDRRGHDRTDQGKSIELDGGAWEDHFDRLAKIGLQGNEGARCVRAESTGRRKCCFGFKDWKSMIFLSLILIAVVGPGLDAWSYEDAF